MKKFNILCLVLLILMAGCNTNGNKDQVATPESLGISSRAIIDFIDALEKNRTDEMHGFVLMRHGQVAAQGWWDPYKPEDPHMLFSLSKSFTSTAIGIAQAEGLLSINDPVISFFPDETPENPSENLKSMRISDLLRMNTGHNEDPTGKVREDTVSWIRAFLALPVEHKPGTRFLYNSAGTFMLSAIIQKVTGQSLLEYLKPRLFDPLGIMNPTWETAPGGISIGGWGLKITTRDIAAFGQLYLQKGVWEGKQLVPEAWVEEATSLRTSNGSNPDSDWDHGYGYQFWRCRHGLYRGDGAFGQYCIVFPEQDAVLAINSGTRDMGAIMNLAWEFLLPAFKEGKLEESEKDFQLLQEKLSSLCMTPLKGDTSSSLFQIPFEETFSIEDNPEGVKEISISLKPEKSVILFQMKDGNYEVPLNFKGYEKGFINIAGGRKEPIASGAAWTAPDSLLFRTFLTETPFYSTTTIAFAGNKISLKRDSYLSMDSFQGIELKGTMKVSGD